MLAGWVWPFLVGSSATLMMYDTTGSMCMMWQPSRWYCSTLRAVVAWPLGSSLAGQTSMTCFQTCFQCMLVCIVCFSKCGIWYSCKVRKTDQSLSALYTMWPKLQDTSLGVLCFVFHVTRHHPFSMCLKIRTRVWPVSDTYQFGPCPTNTKINKHVLILGQVFY